MFSDLHCHPTLNPYNSNGTIWDYDPPKMRQRDNLINTLIVSDFIQADFKSLGKGRVQLVFLSLYPIEYGFLTNLLEGGNDNRTIKDLIKAGLNLFTFGNPEKVLAKVIFNMSGKHYSQLSSPQRDYFTDLQAEYDFLIQGIAKKNGPYRIEIVSDFNHLQQVLSLDANLDPAPASQNILAIVLTIEGAHVFGSGQQNTVNPNTELDIRQLNDLQNPKTQQLLATCKANVRKVKQWNNGKHSPLFVTFSHHFWNQLCGHSMSLATIMNKAFNQSPGMNYGMTKMGEEVLKELLSDQNGRRILIDIKHMSIEGRKWYYNFLQQQQLAVPIIASHMGANGNAIMQENDLSHRVEDDRYDASGTLNPWDVNLSHDELLIIHNSRGIIGLNFDQRILSGCQMVKNLSAISKRLVRDRRVNHEDLLYRSIWAEPILANWLHIVKVIHDSFPDNPAEQERAWELVAIGSDFDGMINALDAYCHAEDFQRLRFVLEEKLRLRAAFDPLLQGKNLTALVEGFLYKNALRFLQRNF
ncbi:MAG: hypothetical protein AB7K37_06595 [Cyclobacteriaceae bacterium]